ncbi:MAG: AAA family ATPase [Sulfurimonas sp.]|nr:AAA family ATPase [Sulfurimonas sp.]
MDKHLLTKIEIKDFKCFKDFKADGFKRVNLIGGKNNVGKTAFMEACYVNVEAKSLKSFVGSLYGIKFMRENLNILNGASKSAKVFIEQSNKIFTKSNINLASFSIEDLEGIKQYVFDFNKQYVKVNINNFSYESESISSIEFIDNFGLFNSQIISNYSAIQKKDDEYFLNDILNKFDDKIEAFKIIDEKPQCKIGDEYLEITEFGDGVRHLISIVTSLYKCENGYLFIDEIDNGIHYTQLDEIWNIILEVSKKLNVQVFATTHSKECIDSYARVSKKLEDKDISYIKMSRLNDGSIKAGVRDFEMLQDSIDDDHEVRGW